jgi:hypothetical protein
VIEGADEAALAEALSHETPTPESETTQDAASEAEKEG